MQFWREQDPLFLTKYNERRLEHYARLAYANLRYSQPRRGVEGWKTNPGQTYIKFGRHRQRLVKGDAYALTETWVYEGFKLDFRTTPRQGLGGRIFNWQSGYAPPMARPDRNVNDPWFYMNHAEEIDAGLEPWTHNIRQRFSDARNYRYLSTSFPETTKEIFESTPSRYIDPYKKQRYTLPHLITAFQERDSVRLEIAYAVPKQRAKSLVSGKSGIVDGIFLFDEDWNEMYRNPKLVTRSSKESLVEMVDSLSHELPAPIFSSCFPKSF
ncbi:MAG: GWxTD domain-containing protein [Candidatus Latescibacteria bacterium]|nr:GWxTD domain-containing protein [Candidatus Latescibacterota bacterium]